MNKQTHYKKFLHVRKGHVTNALNYIDILKNSLQQLEEHIKKTPRGVDYSESAMAFATYAAPYTPLIVRELMSIRIAYEEWKPGAEDYEIPVE
jgi:hypothetical protein